MSQLEPGKLYVLTSGDEPTDSKNIRFKFAGYACTQTGKIWNHSIDDASATTVLCGNIRLNTPFMVLEIINPYFCEYHIMQTSEETDLCEMGYVSIKFGLAYYDDKFWNALDVVKHSVWEGLTA